MKLSLYFFISIFLIFFFCHRPCNRLCKCHSSLTSSLSNLLVSRLPFFLSPLPIPFLPYLSSTFHLSVLCFFLLVAFIYLISFLLISFLSHLVPWSKSIVLLILPIYLIPSMSLFHLVSWDYFAVLFFIYFFYQSQSFLSPPLSHLPAPHTLSFISLVSCIHLISYFTTLRYLSCVSLLFLPPHRLINLLLMPCTPPFIWPLPISCLYFSLSDLPILWFSLPTFKLPLHSLFLFSFSNFLSYVLRLSSIHLTLIFIYPFSHLPVSLFFFSLSPQSTNTFFVLNVIQSSWSCSLFFPSILSPLFI